MNSPEKYIIETVKDKDGKTWRNIIFHDDDVQHRIAYDDHSIEGNRPVYVDKRAGRISFDERPFAYMLILAVIISVVLLGVRGCM